MTHRAESIMQAVQTNITGLAATGTNVSRGRAYPVETVPALTLEQGDDEIIGEVQNVSLIDRLLHFKVIAHAKTNSQFDTVLNQIREQVYIALMASRTQGLGYVIDTMPMGDDQPELSGEAEKNIGQQAMNFAIHYRHSLTNPGA